MELVCWRTLYPTRRTTRIDTDRYKYPYLLKGLEIERSNQVWKLDIAYIAMQEGFMCLFAIMDVYSRYVVGWDLSNTMSAQWCCSVLQEALWVYGHPEIINSDQGSQFTSNPYVQLLNERKIQISMDSCGRALDDIYIERLWRSVKQEYVYINPCSSVKELRNGLDTYFHFYNNRRLHQSLDYIPPVMKYKSRERNIE